MHLMSRYSMMETFRAVGEWSGTTAKLLGGSSPSSMTPWLWNPLLSAWGDVAERSFRRMAVKPDWNIPAIEDEKGEIYHVSQQTCLSRPFGNLVHFVTDGRTPPRRKVLLVAPMSGHYATLLRPTVISLLPDVDLYVTDWRNARDVPVSAGTFDVEDYTLYLADFMRHLGRDTHVIAICQPAPLAIAATAYLAQEEPDAQPASLTLIGGPIDPSAADTAVTDFGRGASMGQLEAGLIQRVGPGHEGFGRKVYPGLLQLSSFIAMNAGKHEKAFRTQIYRAATCKATESDKHNAFYDEYLAVMDMPAEFYLSTVERIFKGCEIGRNIFSVRGKALDLGRISDVAVMTVEGAEDDITAPGQCSAALDLCSGVSRAKKSSHLEPGAGHYGIFAGRSWRDNIRPRVLDFIDSSSAA